MNSTKLTIAAIAVIVIAGPALFVSGDLKGEQASHIKNEEDGRFMTICLDGVEYWHATHHASLAVKIDPTTLQPRRCEKDPE